MQVSPQYLSMFPPSIAIPIIIFLAALPAIIFNLIKKTAFAVPLFVLFAVGSFFYISRFLHFSYLFDLRGFVLLVYLLLINQTVGSSIGKGSLTPLLIGFLAGAVVLLTNEPKLVVGISWLFLALTINKLIAGFRVTRRYRSRNRLFFWLPVLLLEIALVYSYSRNIDQALDILLPLTFVCAMLVLLPNRLPDVKLILRETLRYLLLWLYSVLLASIVLWLAQRYVPIEYHRAIYGLVLVLYLLTFQKIANFFGWSFIRIFSQTHTPAVELIRDLGLLLRNVSDLDDIAAVLGDFLIGKCHANASALIMIDQGIATGGGQELVFWGQAQGDQGSSLVMPAGSDLANWMLRQDGYFYHSDLEGEPSFQGAGEKTKQWFADLQAELFIPVPAKNGWVALVAVAPRIKGTYELEELTFFSALPAQLSGALLNGRLLKQLKESNLQLTSSISTLETFSKDLGNFETIKSNFISIASHELRTPLTVTRGYVEMLLDDQDLPVTQRDLLNGIYKGVLKQEEILDSLFELARLDSASDNLRAEELSLNDVIKEATQKVIKQVNQRRQVLTVDLPTLGHINGDRASIRRLFLNILQNAIKFTPDHGKITITGFQVEASDGIDAGIEIIISDTGVGISKDLQEMIFTRFYQPGEKVDNLSSSKFRFKGSGLGLGLALSRAIVKAHGGRIWAVSDGYDEANLPGTSFHLFFPFQRQNLYPEG